jgi:hypothetical protein
MCACMRATCVHAILRAAYLLEVLVEVRAPQDVHAQLDEQHNLHKSEYPRAIGFLLFGHRRMRGADAATATGGVRRGADVAGWFWTHLCEEALDLRGHG